MSPPGAQQGSIDSFLTLIFGDRNYKDAGDGILDRTDDYYDDYYATDENNDDDAKGDDVIFSIRIMMMIHDDYVDGFDYDVDKSDI